MGARWGRECSQSGDRRRNFGFRVFRIITDEAIAMKNIMIHRSARPLDVDGDLSKDPWDHAVWCGDFTVLGDPSRTAVSGTSFAMVHDGKSLSITNQRDTTRADAILNDNDANRSCPTHSPSPGATFPTGRPTTARRGSRSNMRDPVEACARNGIPCALSPECVAR